MSQSNNKKFFQNEKKFVHGNTYETIKVKAPYRGYTDLETCDEYGDIIPNSELFLGKYVNSYSYGYGDNGGRCDEFINNEGQQVSHYLDYDGTTRYREVRSHMDERIDFLKVVESTANFVNTDGNNEHINKFLLNPVLVKEISSFMNPLLQE
jgi:hypothetical protein